MKRGLVQRKVDELTAKIEELERQIMDVTRMRASVRKSKTQAAKAALEQSSRKGKAGTPLSAKMSKDDAAKINQARAKRMADLVRISGKILQQLMKDKWAWPFEKPVDAIKLRLYDYHQIIKEPMDLGTIKDCVDGKGEKTYTHPQHVCDDVRLTFRNALTYNPKEHDIHTMAEKLLKKWEEKWDSTLVPRLADEEVKRQKEEEDLKEREAMAAHAAEEAAAEKKAQELSKQLDELARVLQELNEKAAAKCRLMTVEEKRQLGYDLGLLPAQNLNRVIQIIAEKQPSVNTAAEEVEVDIDAQDPATLWRLHRYVQSVLNPGPPSGMSGVKGTNSHTTKGNGNKGIEKTNKVAI